MDNFAPVVQQWFRTLPPITRAWLVSTVMVTGLANLNFIDPTHLYLNQWSNVWRAGSKIEAWRLITCFLYAGKFGWGTLIGLHLMSQISSRYEKMGPVCTRIRPANANNQRASSDASGQRQLPNEQTPPHAFEYFERGESSDYVFALLLGCIGILLSKFFLLPYLPYSFTQNQQHIFFHRHLTFYVVYVWSKQHPRHNVNLFGVVMAAAYLPYAYLIMGYALKNGQTIPVDMFHGMFVGHVYYYLACIVPKVLRGRVVIVTPLWLVDICRWMEGRGVLRFGGGGRVDGNPMVVDVDGVIGG